jgi:hypothetical protein
MFGCLRESARVSEWTRGRPSCKRAVDRGFKRTKPLNTIETISSIAEFSSMSTISHLTLKQLRAFVAVYRSRRLAAAAQHLSGNGLGGQRADPAD